MNPLTADHLVAGMVKQLSISAQPTGFVADAQLPGKTSLEIRLPEPAQLPDQSLFECIDLRRSGNLVRRPISLDLLASLLEEWRTPLPKALAPREGLRSVAVPMALDVSGLEAGCYRHDAERSSLLPICPVTRSYCREELLIQSDHANATALIFIVGPLVAWLHYGGNRGYRNLLLEAGWITDRLYLRATALGLSCTASGGFSPSKVNRLLGLDGRSYTALFCFAVGGPHS